MVGYPDPRRHQRLRCAIERHGPARLAMTFALYSGQFYDREPFDVLAREVHALYAASSEHQAATFRARLDARLDERARERVAWDGPDPRERQP